MYILCTVVHTVHTLESTESASVDFTGKINQFSEIELGVDSKHNYNL